MPHRLPITRYPHQSELFLWLMPARRASGTFYRSNRGHAT